MTKDDFKTVVIFRKFKDRGDVIALFPEAKAALRCGSYMHVGQHGEADYNFIVSKTVLASPKEYRALKTELEGLGYDLNVKSKFLRK